jgi:hypothetical protein
VSGLENGVKGVRYVDLSLDPSEWRVHVFKKKVLAILRKLVSEASIDSAMGMVYRGGRRRKRRRKSRHGRHAMQGRSRRCRSLSSGTAAEGGGWEREAVRC